MNKLVVGLLRPYLETLTFIDLLGGLAQTITTGGKAEAKPGQLAPLRRFPASPLADEPDRYQDLTPDSSRNCIVFFEGYDCKVVKRERGLIDMKTVIRVLCWLNVKRLQVTDTEALLRIMKALPEGPLNANGLVKVRINSTRVLETDVFKRYTFDETTRQFLMMPFQAFALELEVSFSLNPDPSCL